MSNFAVTLITGTGLDVPTVDTALEALPTSIDENTVSSVSSASATPVNLGTVTRTIVADEIVQAIYKLNFSMSDTTTDMQVQLFLDGVAQVSDIIGPPAITSTGGNKDSRTFEYSFTGLSGSKVFLVKFTRNAGAGTVYVSAGKLSIRTMKKKA